ncbi:hypothetical protein [Mycobacterium malmoense]|nr:hypothetical protein [Mycobacterium malmoense]
MIDLHDTRPIHRAAGVEVHGFDSFTQQWLTGCSITISGKRPRLDVINV